MITKHYYLTLILVVLGLSLLNRELDAQLSGNNLMEYQLGNIPETDPKDLSSLYDQLNLSYRQNRLKLNMRLEQFYSTDSIKRDYHKITQYSLQYRYKKIELKIGNINETLGRGLLFRSFEILSSVKEEKIFRARHGFYRDIQGISIKYKGEMFRYKALRGKPLNNTFPPGNELQRTELIEAIQPEIILGKHTIGLIAMRHNSDGENTLFSSLFLYGELPKSLNYYGEYARNMTDNSNPFNFQEENGYGGYFSLNHSYGNYGASLELKKYQNFVIGTGISDPPTLIKEHSYILLNRSTHVPELSNESGFQIDIYYSFADKKMLSFNTSRAINAIYDDFTFQEYFLELYWPFKNQNYIKTFIDFTSDELKREKQRITGGIYYTHQLKKSWSINFESELQSINRSFAINQPITNLYLGLSTSKSSKLSLGITYEYTSDENIADRIGTTEIETERHFYGLNFSYRPNQKNTITTFIGERRGGPACSSGVCYEVLDFRGMELRWTSKF